MLRIYDSLCRSKLRLYIVVKFVLLRELDVIHNMGLRICAGASKTSPVGSLYVDYHKLSLDLKREELGL